MAGYVRQSTADIQNGNIIDATKLSDEFNAVQAAFSAATGHRHDGTSSEGPPITVVGPSQEVVVTGSSVNPSGNNTLDLGTNALRFKDLHVNNILLGGTALSTTIAGLMPVTWTLTAGDGLTGGGNGSANRTLTLGTPGSLSASSTNGVTATSHTHTIDSTIARSATVITAGDGLTGGGDLTANRTLNVDSTVVRTSRTLTTGDGLNGGGNLSADRTLSVDSSVVRTSRTVSAGNGLTGGGALSSNQTITMGTPSSITDTSTNSVTSTSHTHAISAATIRTLIADSSPGQVGTYAFLMRNGTSLVAGDTVPGSALFDAGIHVSIGTSGFSNDDTTNANLTARQGTSRSGTWVAMGRSNGQSGTVLMRTTLFLRIA